MTFQFTIIAEVRDKRAGERTFTADALRENLSFCLQNFGLEVGELKVRPPHVYQETE